MTGRHSDGFDWLPAGLSSGTTSSNSTINNLLQARGYYLRGTAVGQLIGASLVTGRFGYGQRFHMQPGTPGSAWQAVVWPIGAQNSAGGYISAAWNIQGTSQQFPFIGVYDLVNDTVLCCVQAAPNGVVKAFRGLPNFGGVEIGASDIDLYNNNADIDVECFIKVHGTTGEIEFRINTVSVLHLTNVNTKPGSNAFFDGICWGDVAVAAQVTNYFIDDFRYYDTDGSINNSWLGTCRVQTSFVNGDGGTTDFTRSNTGLAHWQNLLNQNVDDTLYLFDPTIGDYNLSTVQPLVNSPIVFWAQVTSFVRQDDATQRTFKNRISSGGTLADGGAFFTSQTYTGDSDVFELDPNTGLQFTGAGYNALQIGGLVYA